jgi:serine/threonine protein kinase
MITESGEGGSGGGPGVPAGSGTRIGLGTVVAGATGVPVSAGGTPSASVAGAAVRTTVLPRRSPGGANAPVQIAGQPRFEKLRLLGEGGIGQVNLVHDHDISRSVAVKRLRPDRQGDESLIRFAEEVRIVGQLEHPGIVPVHDVGIDEDGHHYLIMKHIQGDTLEEVIDKLTAGDPAYVARFTIAYRTQIIASMLEALSYAHEKGIIHRDLKPSNVMVGPHGEVTLMDWGIAKHIGDSDAPSAPDKSLVSTVQDRLIETQAGTLVGTPLYMSPEQAAGRNDAVDARSDLFSLGLVMCELLTLHHPLEDKQSTREILAELIAKDMDINRIRGFCFEAGVPMELVYVLRAALARDPAQRYASADAMLAHLRRIQAGEIAVQCHVTAFKRLMYELTHWVDRHPIAFTNMLAVTVLSLVGGLGFGIFRVIRLLLAS